MIAYTLILTALTTDGQGQGTNVVTTFVPNISSLAGAEAAGAHWVAEMKVDLTVKKAWHQIVTTTVL